MDFNYNWDEILGQHNIRDIQVYNAAGVYKVPITGIKDLGTYLDRGLYIVDITDTVTENVLKTKVSMRHYQVIKCFLKVQFPDNTDETLMFDGFSAEELIFRTGVLSGEEGKYTYEIGKFAVKDESTIERVIAPGDYYDKSQEKFVYPGPVKLVSVYALTLNRNIIQS